MRFRPLMNHRPENVHFSLQIDQRESSSQIDIHDVSKAQFYISNFSRRIQNIAVQNQGDVQLHRRKEKGALAI